MNKKLAIFSIVAVLLLAGVVFVSGCDKKATAASEESQSVCQKEVQANCPKTLDSSPKEACSSKKAQACPAGCKMECCAAKRKAGTCPSQSDKTSLPKVCPKKSDAL